MKGNLKGGPKMSLLKLDGLRYHKKSKDIGEKES